ncbi:hypothetical protein KRX51_02340 [Corynebacterium sp. TAE3-ERU12]|uniref:hypothetical protein n=1 Tax=Corynebacterium sp. TAE3-ERU12 TaxID=2849491 RepID=UPI001C4616F5|nr:hypothetical protein [Corynebacterium sp. TAE3-ERU12]MBV7294759.1 hypothetical protein [Corynebacterium sp. TAE3-ERU12]
MAKQGIVPIKLELTEGTAYTLFAPSWRQGNAEWQALLGYGEDVYLFDSPAALLAFLESGKPHDFTDHPKWDRFASELPESAVHRGSDDIDLVGLPKALAGKPDYKNVSEADKVLSMARSIGTICALQKTNRMFASNSVLAATTNGVEHFHGGGAEQWSAIGRVILANWDDVVDEIDELWVDTPEVDEEALTAATTRYAEAEQRVTAQREEAAKKREQEKAQAEKATENADPYDKTVWAAAGIDPIKVSISGRNLYTLRCYVNRRPIFLGRHGEIHTFPGGRNLVRWLLEHDDHDLAAMSTWNDIITAANAGELELTVHEDNEYSFTGLVEDIENGPGAVDTAQLGRAYELLADAADWAGDDKVNEVLAGNQQLQWFINHLLDPSSQDEPVPPYDDEARGWADLEKGLTDRFTTKL